MSIDDLSNRQYANWSSQRTTDRASPTKKVHPQNQLPVDYYSVAPPAVIQQKTTTSTSTPPSSPEINEKYLRDDFTLHSKRLDDEYSTVNPSRMHSIVGDHIVFKENSSHQDASSAVGNEDMYQNLKFLNGKSSNGPDFDSAK